MKTQLRPRFGTFPTFVEKSRPLELKLAVVELRKVMSKCLDKPVKIENSTREERLDMNRLRDELQQQLTTVHTLITFCNGDLDMSNSQLIGLNVLLQRSKDKLSELENETRLVW